MSILFINNVTITTHLNFNNYFKEGDKNTRFFHAQASERRKQNTILGI